ncbi:unnamed protein product [Nesidiocoris tenuis]|uniref:Uncharacterized protein n=1 Tax=Nesidiocoris tenuis TaxID=355587 RepID=A0A6H5FXN0_9HEMI|nr:unnamed protein product [Nesidiocoris tenuis]
MQKWRSRPHDTEVGRSSIHLEEINVSRGIFFSRKTFSKLAGFVLPAALPPAHIACLYYFWHGFARRVDKKYCTCSCWDTVFKGPYESGIGSFKHFYFNASKNTVKIWITTVTCVILFYEIVKRLVELGLSRRLRYNMVALFGSAVFSHYYSWWVYVNYWNDEFYKQWNHQLYFTVTELFSTGLVIEAADKRNQFTRRKGLAIVGIALVHAVAGGVDQFVTNVIRRTGEAHQVVRDLGFMLPDLMHILLPVLELTKTNALRRTNGLYFDLAVASFSVVFGLCVYNLL